MITNLLLEDLGGDSSEDEAKEGTELKQKRVQKRKRESLEILARLETYRKNLEKRRRKLYDQLVKYKVFTIFVLNQTNTYFTNINLKV